QSNRAGTWNAGFKLVQHLDETSGTTTLDSTANGNNGTKVSATSPAPTTGQIGGAQSFNGTSDTIVKTAPTGFPALNGPQSVSAWINYPSASATHSPVFSMDLGFASGQAFLLDLIGNKNFGAERWGPIFLISAPAPAANAWHLVAYTFDGTTNRLYVDGTLQASTTTPASSGAPTEFHIGSFNAGFPSVFWSGRIDEV